MTTCFKIGLGDITSFHRCSSCEYNSITKRHVVPQIPCEDYAVRAMYESSWAIIEAIKVLGITAWSRAEVVATRPARMKKRYNNILHNDIHPGLGKAFIKFEKKELDDFYGFKECIPRMIQYRGSSYTLELARFTVPMEKALTRLGKDCMFEQNYNFPFIAKGLNPLERGRLLHRMWNKFVHPVAHLIDHSTFDSMVNKYHHALEKHVMIQCFPNKVLSWLYSQQVHNKFVTQNGIKYEFTYRRCSGDANTSLGNSLINYCILRACYPDAIILVDGDDSVVITEGDRLVPKFSDYGMKTKYDKTSEFQHIEFCQSRPVETPLGWVMCRNPIRAIRRMNIRLGKQPNLRSWFRTVGIGEGLCSAYMPIISIFAKRFRKAGEGGKFSPWMLEAGERYRMVTSMYSRTFFYPTDEVRASFAIAWGILPDEQREIEQKLGAAVLQ